MWIDKFSSYYKDDFEAFGYAFEIRTNGDVYATCKDFDANGRCI